MEANGDWKVLYTPFTSYKNTQAFKQQTGAYFNMLLSLAETPMAGDAVDEEAVQNQKDNIKIVQDHLNREGINLKYYASNSDINLVVKNADVDLLPIIPYWKTNGYSYIWYYDGQKIQVFDHGKQVDTQRLDSGYQNTIAGNYQDACSSGETNGQVLLAVKDILVKNPYGYSTYYQQQQFLSVIGWFYIVLAIVGIGLLAFAVIRRRDRKEFECILASWSKGMWFEVKAFLSLLLLFLLTNVSLGIGGESDILGWVLRTSFISCCILFVLWWFYLMLLDLIANKKEFYTHNIVNSLITWYRRYERKYPWQKGMLKRAYTLVAVEAVLALTSVIFLYASLSSSSILFIIALLLAGTGIYILYRYLRQYEQTLSDLGRLTDHIQLIKNGEMNSRLELMDDSPMYRAAENLNAIQEGMQTAVAKMIKSERMKIDLITNVSHDLKTPLTSIISYVDLLNREEGLPEHVSDYIKILEQKSERLKNLIQDLFDLSKASSGNATMNTEKLDLARLIKQTLADMQEPIDESGLAFRLNIPDEPVYVFSDGKKLYRVWENLIANALKYSLPVSRVFVDLTVENGRAQAVIKNIANYEMDFDEDEILQRFVRGDEARNTEGSGLGLSIAQQFTQICGGDFAVKIDGDLFKAEMVFNVV
jgi:signal transduction histidine kinase